MKKGKIIFVGIVVVIIGVYFSPILPTSSAPDANGPEINYDLIINRIAGKELYSEFYGAFQPYYWPLMAPTDITASNYAAAFTFNATYGINQTDNLYYGNAYRGTELVGYNKKSLLILSQVMFESESTFNDTVYSLYENFSWSYAVYVEHTDENIGVDRLVLSFRSPIDPVDSQVWSGWFIWTYNSEGIAERFDLIVWRIDATLVNDYDPLTNPDKSDLTAYYELTYEIPGVINETLAIVLVFMGGVSSILIAPFVVIGFLIRRPIREYVTTENFTQMNLTSLYIGGKGKVKLAIGIVITLILLGFQFIFPSETATLLVSVLLTGFLWFGIYLILKSFIESRSKSSVQFIPLILLSLGAIIIGFYGIQTLNVGINRYINPDMFESMIFVNILYYGTTLGALLALALIYEGTYQTRWDFSPDNHLFIVERKNPFVQMKEKILADNLAEIKIDVETRRARYSTFKVAILRLLGKPGYKSKEHTWQLTSIKSYQNLFKAMEVFKKYNLISEGIIESISEKTGLSAAQIEDKERWIKLEEKYPELRKEKPTIDALEKQLAKLGIVIEKVGRGNISINIPNYGAQAFMSNLVNFILIGIITTILIFSPIILLASLLEAGFSVLNRPIIFLVVTMVVLGCFCLYQCFVLLKRILQLRSQNSVSLKFDSNGLNLQFNQLGNGEREYYQLSMLYNLIVKRNFFSGVKLCLGREYNNLPLLFFNDRKKVELLKTYISQFLHEIFLETRS